MSQKPSLLLAEDEPLIQQALAQFFGARGYEVVRTGSLAESRDRLDASRFDAVILDVGLPDGDGLDLLDRVSPERVVVISANPQPDRYARRAVRHHFAKPLDLEILGRAVDALLEAA